MAQENVALVRGMYESFAAGDLDALLATLSPDVVWNEAENFPFADLTPYCGPKAVAERLFARLAAEWELAVVPAELIDAGDTIVALGRFKGRFRASGKPMDAQFAHVWRVKDGKVTAFDEYADTLQAALVMQAA